MTIAPLLAIIISTGSLVLLCLLVGWGSTRLALPDALRSDSALFTPLIGMGLLMCLGYAAVSTSLSLRQALPLIVLLALALNLLAWRRHGPPRLIPALRQHALLLAIALLALLAGILPLLQYGYLTIIGRGWDPESYLPMAQYLNDYPLTAIPSAPTSPLRDLVSDPPRIGLTLGFSVLQGFMMILSGQSAIATFAPLLALLRGLSVIACYLALHKSLGLQRPAALLATLGIALGSLMLWVAFFNFGMQISAWPLIGLGLVLGLSTIDHASRHGRAAWPSILLCALMLVAIPVAYYPALTVFAPLVVGLGAARLVECWRQEKHQIGAILAAAAVLATTALLLAIPTIIDYNEGFAFRYSLVAQKIGPDRFIALSDTLGLSAFRLESGGQQPPDLLLIPATLIAAILALLAALRPGPPTGPAYRLRWLFMLLPIAGYLIWLQYLRPYEYAFMKTSAYLGILGWGVIALGWQQLTIPAAAGQHLWRWGRALLIAIPLGSALWSQLLIINEHSRGPALFGSDLIGLAEPIASIPPTTPVLISGQERFVGPNNGMIASMLYPRPIWGRISTAYFGQSLWPEGGSPGYALLAADEPAWPLELGASEIWRSQLAVLYRFDPQAHILLGRSAIHRVERPSEALAPAANAIWRRAGALATSTAAAPLTLQIGNDLRLTNQPASGPPAAQQIHLTVATLVAQPIQLAWGDQSASFDLPAGVSQLQLTIQAPTTLTLSSQQMVALAYATARPSEIMQPATLTPDPGQVAWRAAATQQGDQIDLTLQLSGQHALRAEISLVEDTYDGARRLVRVLAGLPSTGEWQLRYQPAAGTLTASAAGQPTPLLQSEVSGPASSSNDGKYFAALTIYSGEGIAAQVPLARFQLTNGAISNFETVPFSLEALRAGPPAQAAHHQRMVLLGGAVPLDGRATQLNQIMINRQLPTPGTTFDTPITAGEQLTIQLFWQANQPDQRPLAISAQLIGPDDRKAAQWDGLAGGDWHPATTWAAAEQIRQDLPLTIDPQTPPGRYRIILAAYDPATGQPQPIAGQNSITLAEVDVR
jgi:hypothetical protein